MGDVDEDGRLTTKERRVLRATAPGRNGRRPVVRPTGPLIRPIHVAGDERRGQDGERRFVMVAVLENKREAIVALCRKYGVVRMDVFGSAVRDDFRPGESDVELTTEASPVG